MNNSASTQPDGKKITILQVLPALHSGGVERGTVDIARMAVKAGYNSLVASSGGVLVKQLEAEGSKHIELPLESKNPITMFGNISHLYNTILEHRVDIVHGRSRAPAWSAYFAAKKASTHFITTVHGAYPNNFPLKKSYNRIMTKGVRVIAVSEFVRSYLKSEYLLTDNEIRLVHRGVDLELFDPAKVSNEQVQKLREHWGVAPGIPIILMPARFTRWKGHLSLLAAMKRMSTKRFCCIMLGNADKHESYRKEIDERIAEYGLQENVKIYPQSDNMPVAYMAANVVVVPSIEPESFGRISIEAQAMGKPVIATALGATVETIIHRETGRLVPPYRTKELSDALEKGIDLDEQMQANLAINTRKNVREKFSLDKMAEQTFAVYQEVLTGKRQENRENF